MRMRSALSTLVVAIAMIFALPFSQLRWVSFVEQCCCPEPEHCGCPDHAPDSSQPSMSQCHKTVDTIESASAPSFAPALAIAEPVAVRALVAAHHAARSAAS